MPESGRFVDSTRRQGGRTRGTVLSPRTGLSHCLPRLLHGSRYPRLVEIEPVLTTVRSLIIVETLSLTPKLYRIVLSSLSVPVSPPNPARLEEGKKRLLALMGDCDCKLFLTSTEGKQLLNASFFRSEQTLLFVNTTAATHSLVPHDTTIYNHDYYKLNASIHNTRCSSTPPTTHTHIQ